MTEYYSGRVTEGTKTAGAGQPYWAWIPNYPWSQKPCNCCPHCGGKRLFETTTKYDTGNDIDAYTTGT